IKGLVVRETPSEVLLWMVSRKPGERAFARLWTEPREEIDSVEKLDGRDRKLLVERVKALDPSGKLETERMKSLQLQEIPSKGDSTATALRYNSVYFTLESNAEEDLVRRAAVRLDQIYSSYARFLPPRLDSGEPTTILLVRSFDDFQRVLKDKGRTLLNPAVYNSEANRIVCWSELQKLGEDMGRARKLNQQLLDELDQRKTDLSKLYKKVPADLLAELEEKRRQILKAKRANEIAFDATFRKTTQRL